MARVSNPGFTEPENPGFGCLYPGISGLNFDLHCLIKRPYIQLEMTLRVQVTSDIARGRQRVRDRVQEAVQRPYS